MCAWDATKPATTTKVKDSPAIFQGNWVALDGSINEEHEAMDGTTPGAHLPGECGVMFVGATADIAALTPPACATAYNTTLSASQYYNGSTWVTINPNHGLMTGLASGDPHTQYLNLNKAGQTILQSISVEADQTIDGRDISVDGVKLDTLGGLGSWEAKSNNTVYLAATDGFVTAWVSSTNAEVYGYTDSSNPPTTVRLKSTYNGASAGGASITLPVKKGEYWKVTGAATVYWIPLGA